MEKVKWKSGYSGGVQWNLYIGRNGRVEGCNRHELHVPALQLPSDVHRALLVNIDWLLSRIKSQNMLLTEKSDTV